MKFFIDKKIIFTLFTINLFNNVLADGYSNYMDQNEFMMAESIPVFNNNAPQSGLFLITNNPEVKNPTIDYMINHDGPSTLNIQQGANRQPNDNSGSGNGNNISPPSTAETTENSAPLSTTTTPTTTTTTVPTPKPTDPAPAPKPQNQFVAAIVTVIKSIFNFLWSHRGAIWNFFNTNILTPIWNWIKQKWFS